MPKDGNKKPWTTLSGHNWSSGIYEKSRIAAKVSFEPVFNVPSAMIATIMCPFMYNSYLVYSFLLCETHIMRWLKPHN